MTKLERGEICGTLQCLVQMGVKTATELCMCVLSYDARKGLGNFVTFFVLLQWKGHYSRPTRLVSSKYQFGYRDEFSHINNSNLALLHTPACHGALFLQWEVAFQVAGSRSSEMVVLQNLLECSLSQ